MVLSGCAKECGLRISPMLGKGRPDCSTLTCTAAPPARRIRSRRQRIQCGFPSLGPLGWHRRFPESIPLSRHELHHTCRSGILGYSVCGHLGPPAPSATSNLECNLLIHPLQSSGASSSIFCHFVLFLSL
ncbi:hypothetical protein M758_3G182800 [Ceratodon purpureus]|nr:hypothetical protein M758_3G182800 [Ceratodon purpureus]